MRGSPPYSPLASPIPGAAATLVTARTVRRTLLPFFCLGVLCVVAWQSYPTLDSSADGGKYSPAPSPADRDSDKTLIIIITPTYAHPTRLPEMTRLAQTLTLVKNIHWIVIEDGNHLSDAVQRLLRRSGLPHTYMYTITDKNLPRRGWTHRNMALDIVRTKFNKFKGNAVVYFADDDNTYDVRLFTNYIRNVKRIGFWAVGFSGGSKVEAPHVENGSITKWDVVYAPSRKFATDMAGFAVNLALVINSTAHFAQTCGPGDPENCFLKQFNIPLKELEAFGYDEQPRDVLVWHTQSKVPKGAGADHGYVYEEQKKA